MYTVFLREDAAATIYFAAGIAAAFNRGRRLFSSARNVGATTLSIEFSIHGSPTFTNRHTNI